MTDTSAGRGIGHPAVRRWVRRHPSTRFRQTADEPEVTGLIRRLGLGSVVRDLAGEDNLNLLVNSGRHVLRTYKPFVTRSRLAEVQQVRTALAGQGLDVAVPCRIGAPSIFRCGQRWAEVEPFLDLPSEGTSPGRLYEGLGRLHRALAERPHLSTHDLRRSFVSCRTLRLWTDANVEDGLIGGESAAEIRCLIRLIESRWVEPDDLPAQVIHTDPHGDNIIAAGSGAFVYLDFGGIEVAPRVHDVAIALPYQLAVSPASSFRELHEAYAEGAGIPMSNAERAALPVYAAAVAMYYDICGWATGRRDIARQLMDLSV